MQEECPKNCTQYRAIIDPRQIHYLRFILEAYEGLALVSTLDQKLGLVLLSIAPGCEEDVLSILQSESASLGFRPLTIQQNPEHASC